MSVRVMSLVWENPDLSATDKIVMLSLADHADDEGRCYPSINRLVARTGLKIRTVQTAIKRLEQGGYLIIELNAGKRGTNLYTVIPTPAVDAPPQEMHPAADAPTPRTRCTPTPARDAPEPSVTINEPSEEDKARAQKVRLPEGWVPDDDCVAYAISKKLTPDEIQEIADDFHAYWTDRTDAGGRKSQRGWRQAWRNRVRDQAPRFIRNRGVAFKASPREIGHGGGIAGVVARRQSDGAL